MIIIVIINDLNEKQTGSLKGVPSLVDGNAIDALDGGMYHDGDIVEVHLDITQYTITDSREITHNPISEFVIRVIGGILFYMSRCSKGHHHAYKKQEDSERIIFHFILCYFKFRFLCKNTTFIPKACKRECLFLV